jgi:hypothetical protein
VTRVNQGPPLPLPHPDGRVISVGVELIEVDAGDGAVLDGYPFQSRRRTPL